MRGMHIDIDEKTKISVYALVGAVPLIVAGAIWVATIEAKATGAGDRSYKNEALIERQMGLLIEIKERLIRLEEKLTKER